MIFYEVQFVLDGPTYIVGVNLNNIVESFENKPVKGGISFNISDFYASSKLAKAH